MDKTTRVSSHLSVSFTLLSDRQLCSYPFIHVFLNDSLTLTSTNLINSSYTLFHRLCGNPCRFLVFVCITNSVFILGNIQTRKGFKFLERLQGRSLEKEDPL